MKSLLQFLLLFIIYQGNAQEINGVVTDSKNTPISGVNVYIEGTYDGSSTDENGKFSFSTEETGTQLLVASYLAYETFTFYADISEMTNVTIVLRENVNALDAVVISAGTFAAGDNSKINALSALDVVTTASALGDFVGAFQTLPGTTTVSEDGRLFVRGGDAEETQIFIDGIRVFTPYTPSANNTPTRGRYSPFLFDGFSFSTGGYSAEYGQALSSVLLLNTVDEPNQDKTDIGIMSVGASVGNTQKWSKSSLSVNVSYINLAPYNAIFKDRNTWHTPYQGGSGEAVFRQKFNNGLLKLYTAFDSGKFELTQEDINISEGVRFKTKNGNFYTNASYKGTLENNWFLLSGLSYTIANNKIGIQALQINNQENSFHGKLKLKKRFSNRFKLSFGADYLATLFKERLENPFVINENTEFKNNISAVFTEADVFFSKKLALKVGLRAAYSEALKNFDVSPRLSLAYKTSKKSQVSFAYGDFYQNPNADILKYTNQLKPQKTSHYILNYQYNNERRIFRAETYFKDYMDLVKYDTQFAQSNSIYNNSGAGFAKGLDLFWRDGKSIKNIDYWVSYSFLDAKRDYKNYIMEARPNFVNTHNFSVVGKYWIEDWKSQIGLSYTFASGRTYTNPNQPGFLNAETKSYNSLSVNWAYLMSPQKILYVSINNVLGFRNINGYQYANSPDVNGNFARRSLQPAADQFFFIGFFWTISEKGTDNQLDNL